MTVSVIIPTYGHRDYVREAVDSAFAQHVDEDVEVIVVNDGSPDDTDAVLRPLVDTGRIRYFEQPNAGQGAARNRGLAEARGEFVAYLDDDDLWPTDKLAWQVRTLREHPEAVLVYGDHAQLRPNGKIVPDDKTGFPSGRVYQAFRRRNWIHSLGQTLIRTAALRGLGGLDTSIWGSDDWDLYIRLARQGEFRYVNRTALHYRVHPHNASRRAVHHVHHHFKVMRKHMGANLPLMAWHLRLAGDYFVPNLLDAAADAKARGDRRAARQAYRYCLLFKPHLLLRPHFLRAAAEAMGRTPQNDTATTRQES